MKTTTYRQLAAAGDNTTLLRPLTASELFGEFAAGLHGHVVKREDGNLARCGGPVFCKRCQSESEIVKAMSRHIAEDTP